MLPCRVEHQAESDFFLAEHAPVCCRVIRRGLKEIHERHGELVVRRPFPRAMPRREQQRAERRHRVVEAARLDDAPVSGEGDEHLQRWQRRRVCLCRRTRAFGTILALSTRTYSLASVWTPDGTTPAIRGCPGTAAPPGCRLGGRAGRPTGAAPVFLIGGGATALLLVLVLALQPAVRQLD